MPNQPSRGSALPAAALVLVALSMPLTAEAGIFDWLFGNKSLNTLNGAVTELGEQPKKWESVLRSAIGALEGSANRTVTHTRKELEALLSSAQAGFNQTAQCQQDIIGKRVLLGVQEIRFALTKKEADRPTPTPLVCSVIQPTPVAYGNLPGALEFSGFSFKRYEDRGLQLRAALAYADGTTIAEVPVAVESDYKASLQVQTLAASRPCVDPAKAPRLVLSWDGPSGKVERSEVPVTTSCEHHCGARQVTVDKLYDNTTLMSGHLVCSSGWRHGTETVTSTCVTSALPRPSETVGYSGSCTPDHQPTTELTVGSGTIRVVGDCASVSAQFGLSCR